jgi:Tfp pilus assembly protein PilN
LEGASLDVTPNDWSELREESRFKKKLATFLTVAAAGWVVVMGTLFGGPIVYDQLTEHQKTICKRHSKAHKEVKEMRDKVKLVQQYSDHARGTLEMLKAVSDRMPEGVTLTSFNYRRGEKLSISGEADQPTVVYDFKNAVTEVPLFESVGLTGPSANKGKHKFDIDAKFKGVTRK